MTKASFKVLSLDKEILVLPLMAGVLMIAAVLGIGYGMDATQGAGMLLLVLLSYFVVYAIVIYFNAAVIEMATIRFNGGDPVVKDGLRKASSKWVRILQWAAVAATVGLIMNILRQLARDRESFLGQILVSVAETAWNVATFFAVPLAIYQDLGPIDAIRASTSRMKRTWGESISGMVTTGIIFLIVSIPGWILGYLAYGYYESGVLDTAYVLGGIAVVYLAAVAAVNMAIDGILVAALYKYSTDGNMPEAYREQGIEAQGLAW